MVRGFYTACSGILTKSRTLDTISENMANATTSGYKQEATSAVSFRESLIYNSSNGSGAGSNPVGSITGGAAIGKTSTDYTQSALKQTGNPFDFAISGAGFFTVQEPGGQTGYTRNGEFSLDSQGYIVNGDGARLMGENGAINTGGMLFSVSPDGSVYVGENIIDRIAVYDPADTSTLVRQDSGIFYETGTPGQNAFGGSISQGFLEKSNVDMLNEMMAMIKNQRGIQSCSQVAKMIDETVGQAVRLGERM